MNVKVVRVDIKAITETVPVQFKEVIKVNKSLANTKKLISQEGKDGEKKVTTQITYEDGKEVSREIVGETIIKNARDKVIVQGTYPYMPVSRNGSIMSYSRVFQAKATAYWAVSGIGKTYTASGRLAVWNPDGYSTIAVDRSIIPYGTKLFIEGYGFAIAADTGSAIIGNKIDVYFNTIQQARSWGAKYVKVYVLK
jgi:3D (Asp-Asp-Asp) domain-containing protein